MTPLKTTKNWCYGAKTPDIEQAVSDAIFAAHQYRNELCALELDKRARHEESLARLAPSYVTCCMAVESLEEELEGIREKIQSERVKQRTKRPIGVEALTERAKEIRNELKDARAARKDAKKASYENDEVKAAMDENSSQHKADVKQAKQASGLYWGTEAIVKQACASFSSGAPPKFKRYEGEGQLAVQLQGGLSCDDAVRYNTLCYMENITGKKADCLIRIGSESGKPIFARVPIVFHRPLPDSGRIKWAYLERRKIASHVRWTIRLTIDCELPADRCRDGEVAIHTGWAMEPSGLRVATWRGSDGKSGVLRLSASHCDDYDRVSFVRSQRDTAFNEMVGSLREWLKDRPVPEWMVEPRKYIHAWKAPARLSKLYWQWAEDRIDGDTEVFDRLNVWRKEDKHRWQHERRLMVRITRRRKDIYRKFAKQLSDRYGVAYLTPVDAKRLNENTNPEELERDNTSAHRHSKWAAVSDLTQCIREKFPLHCIELSPIDITRQCSRCGEIHKHDITNRRIQCHDCGLTIDVDENAVKNTLARGEAAMKSGALLELLAAEQDKAAKQEAKLMKMQDANRAARKASKAESEKQGQNA